MSFWEPDDYEEDEEVDLLNVGTCQTCGFYTQEETCPLCKSEGREGIVA